MAVVALSGVIGVGKSSVAARLAQALQWEIRSYGEVIRAEANRRGLSASDRSVLQAVGSDLIETIRPSGLTDRLLAAPFENLIIDGVRHVDVLEDLKVRLSELVSVLMIADDDALDARWATRGDGGSRRAISGHAVEAEILSLRGSSTIVIDTTDLSPQQTADAIIARLAR